MGRLIPLFTRPDWQTAYLTIMLIENKVSRTITEYQLLSKGDSVLVALSGGPDSVALLYMLDRMSRKYRLTLSAVYINHNIRKQAALKEEEFCQKLCDRLGIELFIVKEDIPVLAKATRKSVEEAARDFRYETFDRLSAEHDIDKIALGHHVDDRVETVFFRIIRGTGRTGLRGILPRRGRIIRPLYDLTKDEIYGYLKKHRLKYCVDQSNLGVDYSRNYIRNRLLTDIREKLNPAVDRAILNLSELAADDEAFLDEYMARRLKGMTRKSVGGKIELDLNKYNSYDKWFRRRLLRHCLAELSGFGRMSERAVVDRLDDLCLARGKGMSIPGGLHATLAGDKMVFYRRSSPRFSMPLTSGKPTRLITPGLNFRMTVYSLRSLKLANDRRSRTVMLDHDKVQPPIVVRNIRQGDRFQPLGLRGTKKVGDYLTNRKVHSVYRDEVPVVCDSRGIIWLAGFEISDRVKIDSTTRKVLKIGFSRRNQRRIEAV